jgi:uncharacterized protein (DUF362 family)
MIPTRPLSKANVVVGTRESAADKGEKLSSTEVTGLLNDSILAATGKTEARAAWQSLFTSRDTVGIKVNCLARRGLSSHPELVAAVVRGLETVGIAKNNIIVWDRSEEELAAAGFEPASVNGARVLATDSRRIGYERNIEFSGEIGSCFSTILSRMCTAVINIPVLKDHDLSGVSLGMKNFYGAIHNPNKYHDHNCNPYIADLCAHPLIAKKLRLIICDGLKGQYHGGPAYRPQWSWPAATLVVGTDPVAVDRIGLEIIERKRQEMGMTSLGDAGRAADYIETAATRGLGKSKLKDIAKIIVT